MGDYKAVKKAISISFCLSLVIILSFILAPLASANPTKDDDGTWDSRFYPLDLFTDGQVSVMASQGNDLYIAGEFSVINNDPMNGIARREGTHWEALGEGVELHADQTLPCAHVFALAFLGDDLYVGGDFAYAGGQDIAYLARWNPQSGWSAVGDLYGPVYSLYVYNNDLYVGGENMVIYDGHQYLSYLAKWNPSDGWSEAAPKIDGEVSTITSLNGILYIGGWFSKISDLPVSNIASWDGTTWSDMGGGLNGEVSSLSTYAGAVYAGGNFTAAGGDADIQYLGEWDGNAWSKVGSGPTDAVGVVLGDSSGLYVAGFDYGDGWNYPYIGKWDGHSWADLGYPMKGVHSIHVHQGELYIGGHNRTDYTDISPNLMKWVDQGWQVTGGKGFWDNPGNPVAHQGRIYVRNARDGHYTDNGLYWDGDTWQHLPMIQGVSTFSAYTASGSSIYGIGAYTPEGGSAENCVLKWDGSSWTVFGCDGPMGTSLNAYDIRAMAVRNDQAIFIGGDFSAINGVSLSNLAQWNGSAWLPVGGGTSGVVNDLTVQGNLLHVGGAFKKAGTQPGTASYATWDGQHWSGMTGLPAATTTAFAIDGSSVYIGQQGSEENDAPTLFKCMGTGCSPIGTASSFNWPVYDLDLSGSNLYVVGQFTQVEGKPINNITRWDGSQFHGLGSGIEDTWPNANLAVVGNDLYISGSFIRAGGKSSAYFAHWSSPLLHIYLPAVRR
jgi:trimeric autotransporter adhesin